MERILTEYLINAVWQVPLLAAGAWCLVRIARPAPHVQHAVWLAALGLAIILPAHGVNRAEAAQGVRRSMENAVSVPAPQPSRHPQAMEWLASFPTSRSVAVGALGVQWLVKLYFGAVALGLLRVAHAWRTAYLLAAHAHESTAHEAALKNFSRRLQITPPQTRRSTEIVSPMIVGITTPILLLPEALDRFTAEEISAALCHELAHIKRRDYLSNLACQLAAVPLLWHPALHLIQQRIRMTREMACDALAARELQSEFTYAKCLLSLADAMLRGVTAQPGSIGLFGGWYGKNTLEERIMQLTEKTTSRIEARASRMVVGAAIMSASLVMAATFHLTPTMASTTNLAAQTGTPVVVAPPPAQAEEAPVPANNKPDAPHHRVRKEDSHARQQEQARVQQQVDAMRQQLDAANAMLQSETFQRDVENAQRQALQAESLFNSDHIQQQVDEAQRQSDHARAFLNSLEFRKQMEEAKEQAAIAKAMVDSPEFQKQIEQAKQRAKQAADRINNNPEFKRQMEEMQQRTNEMMKNFHFNLDGEN